jgi:hypothetical protein
MGRLYSDNVCKQAMVLIKSNISDVKVEPEKNDQHPAEHQIKEVKSMMNVRMLYEGGDLKYMQSVCMISMVCVFDADLFGKSMAGYEDSE